MVKKNKDVGIVKQTYITIIEKVARNIDGLAILLQSDRLCLENNRQPIMLLLRGVIDDLFVGTYLFRLRDDEVSFTNELKVIELQYAKFSEFLITREPHIQASKEFKGLSANELDDLVKKN